MNKGIKEIIDQFPELEDILNEYDIGCGPCGVLLFVFRLLSQSL